jgi:hypothetical protein
MKRFATLVEALDDLRKRGFTEDFDLHMDCIKCGPRELILHPEEFEIVEVHRFEGASDPACSDVIYAIEGPDGLKGVITDAYGVYADRLSTNMLAKLRIHH